MTIKEIIEFGIFNHNNSTWKLTHFECENMTEYILYCNGAEYKRYTPKDIHEVIRDIGLEGI